VGWRCSIKNFKKSACCSSFSKPINTLLCKNYANPVIRTGVSLSGTHFHKLQGFCCFLVLCGNWKMPPLWELFKLHNAHIEFLSVGKALNCVLLALDSWQCLLEFFPPVVCCLRYSLTNDPRKLNSSTFSHILVCGFETVSTAWCVFFTWSFINRHRPLSFS
jgi:hypothetical protein